jgi:hypothetical protein
VVVNLTETGKLRLLDKGVSCSRCFHQEGAST